VPEQNEFFPIIQYMAWGGAGAIKCPNMARFVLGRFATADRLKQWTDEINLPLQWAYFFERIELTLPIGSG